MDTSPENQKVIDLLSQIKDQNEAYPPEMLSSRREAYLQQMVNLGLGIGAGSALKDAAKGGNGTGAATTISSKFLEMILVAAIALEAGTITFLNRNKIADTIRNYVGSPKVQEVILPEHTGSFVPEFVTSSPTIPVSETSEITPSATATATATPSPQFTGESTQTSNNNGSAGATNNVNATPNPAEINGNNGNQYGLTPKPVRTKENNGNNINSNSGNGNSSSSNGNAGSGSNSSNNGKGNNK